MPKVDKGYDPPKRTHVFLTEEEIASGKKPQWQELEIVSPVKNLSSKLWQLHHLTALYLSKNSLTRVPPDIAKLKNLIHLDLSYNKLRSLPTELGDMTQLRELLLSHNHLRVLPYELGRLFQLQVLSIAGNPIQAEILSMVSEPNGTARLLSFLLDNLQMAPRPPDREWVELAPPDARQVGVRFSVMSYNVLCDKYATPQVYGYCPSWALNWEYRKEQLLKEINDSMADIVALQEVETEQYFSYFLPQLSSQGYEGIFQPKSRARTMHEEERKHVDGCAIFYHNSKFKLVDQFLVEFNQLAMANAAGSDDMLNRVMLRDNIGLASLLEVVPPSEGLGGPPQHLLVANAHIHWDPEYRDVKLIQMVMLMSELEQIVSKVQQEHGIGQKSPVPDCPGIPLIMCGDLNSLPDSSVIEFLKKGKIPITHPDIQDFNYEGFASRVSTINGRRKADISHQFPIQSAYTEDQIVYSNYTYDFKGVIDYVFYSFDFLRLQGLLGPVSKEWFQQWRIIGCPNPHFPSDHFPLLCQFELAPPM